MLIRLTLTLTLLTAATLSAGTVYDSTSGSLDSFVFPGGATTIGSNTITRILADDIYPIAGATGSEVSEIWYAIANVGATDVTFRRRTRFWDVDPGDGGPGTFIDGFSGGHNTLAPGAVGLFIGGYSGLGFYLPASPFWLGVAFDNDDGTTGATAAELNNLAVILLTGPQVGSSTTDYFYTTDPGSFAGVDIPAGTIGTLGSGLALGFAIVVTPEPGTVVLAFLGLAALFAAARRRPAVN